MSISAVVSAVSGILPILESFVDILEKEKEEEAVRNNEDSRTEPVTLAPEVPSSNASCETFVTNVTEAANNMEQRAKNLVSQGSLGLLHHGFSTISITSSFSAVVGMSHLDRWNQYLVGVRSP